MRFHTIAAAVAIACATTPASAQLFGGMIVQDPAVLAQAVKQVKAWTDQYAQMRQQIESMTGDRGMANLLSHTTPLLPPDWQQSMTRLTSLAQQIRTTQAVMTPAQAALLSQELQLFLSRTQDISAANQAMAQTAFNDAAARQSRLQILTTALAGTKDPKAAYDLANRIAIEHTALLQDQNQLEAAANGGAAQDRAHRLMVNQMRAASAGTEILKIDTSLP